MTRPTLVILPTVDSTNNHAMRELRAGLAQDGTAYFALEQTQGKGQREKKWNSNTGENIMMSVVWKPGDLGLSEQFCVSCATALACADFFKKYAGEDTLIKWPNDLYWNDRKAGGILIENVIKGSKWETAVIGIGININQVDFPELGSRPVSLKQITGKPWDVHALAQELYCFLQDRLAEVRQGESKRLISRYNSVLFRRGQSAKFLLGNMPMEAIIEGVNEKGELLLKDAHAKSHAFGQIEWIL